MNIISKSGKNQRLFLLTGFIAMVVFLWGASPMQARAAGRTVSIESCQIAGDQVVCQLKASQIPFSDDGWNRIWNRYA